MKMPDLDISIPTGNMFGIQLINFISLTMKLRLLTFFIFSLLLQQCGLFDSDSTSEPEIFYPVSISGEWGYINKSGQITIEPQFQLAGNFSEGFAPVRYNWRWAYTDATGELAIDGNGVFQQTRPFSEGIGAVQIEGRIGFINQDGEFIINPAYRAAGTFFNKRCFVRSLDYRRYFYIDDKGNELPMPAGIDSFNEISEGDFSDERALIRFDGKYGFIDTEGNLIIQHIYTEAKPFSENLAAVQIAERWGFVDKNGEIEITPQFIWVGSFKNGLAPARISSNLYGFINKKAEMVISEQFEEVRNFSEERAAVKLDEKWGFIDKEGAPVIGPQFEQVDDFYGDLARFTVMVPTEDGQAATFGYVDKNGKIIWPATR
jgi:hypothetical protein